MSRLQLTGGVRDVHTGCAMPSGTAAGRHKSRLGWARALTTTFMAVEVIGGLWTDSPALLADAAHNLTAAYSVCLRGTD